VITPKKKTSKRLRYITYYKSEREPQSRSMEAKEESRQGRGRRGMKREELGQLLGYIHSSVVGGTILGRFKWNTYGDRDRLS